MCLSHSTEEGLIVSSLSMVKLIKETLQSGADYVLARRLNQDQLQAYFGYCRRRGGHGDAPTIRGFSSNAKNFQALKCSSVFGSNVQLV